MIQGLLSKVAGLGLREKSMETMEWRNGKATRKNSYCMFHNIGEHFQGLL